MVEITNQMEKHKNKYLEAFKHFTTTDREITKNPGGFFGVGILKKPKKHCDGTNTIDFLLVGLNSNGTKIVINSNFDCNEHELRSIYETIGKFLKKIN